MSDPFLGEIRLFAGNFAPRGYQFCRGQLLPIGQNQALFALLGTTFGGNGQTTFALPDLQGRIPVHRNASVGPPLGLGETGGEEQVTLSANQLPAHTHVFPASALSASTGVPTGTAVADASAGGTLVYSNATGGVPAAMSPAAVGPAGASMPHENRMPYLAMSFIIAVEGIFPSRN